VTIQCTELTTEADADRLVVAVGTHARAAAGSPRRKPRSKVAAS